MKPIPEYDGQWCQSSCNHQTECYHPEEFDREHGIVRSGLDFDIESDKETRHYEIVWADGTPMTKVDDNILLK